MSFLQNSQNRKNHRTIFGRGYLLQCLLRAYLIKTNH